MMRLPPEAITLYEHAEVTDVSLSPAQARALAAFRFASPVGESQSLRLVEVSPGRATGTYNLRGTSIVGSVSIAGIQINVLPKAGVGRTAQMLAHTLGLERFLRDGALFTDAQSFSDLLAPAFLAETEEVVRQGLVEDYVPVAEIGTRPRGGINFGFLARTGLPSPVEYRYDDFVGDTPVNQLLARALRAVIDMYAIPPELHADARQLLGPFSSVSFVDWPPLYRGEELPERIRHYRQAMTLATLILEGVGIEPVSGARRVQGLLFDMNRVFESFITAMIRRSAPDGCVVDVQGRLHPLYLDVGRHYRLKPDFGLWNRFGCRLVGDVKYKTLDAQNGPRRPDLYQMVSYAAAAGVRRAILIYVGRNSGTNIEVAEPDVTIEVRAVDVDQNLDDIQNQVQTILANV